MNTIDVMQILLFFGLLIVVTPVLGGYMARVLQGQKTVFSTPISFLERMTYRLLGIDSNEEMSAKEYLLSVIWFSLWSFIAVFLLQLFQSQLPYNPQRLDNVSWHLSFNTAVSFVTNTNWQSYAGETTLSYLVQMIGLTVQNFLSAAVGVGVLLALIRGLTRRESQTLGNFWVDLTRSTLYIFLPLSILLAVVLVSQGVVQNFLPYATAKTLEGVTQIIPMGPAASQIAIKQLGTNGGGFFNANSAHPFENPTSLSNLLQMLSILMIPSALTYTYGVMVKNRRQGWILFAAMFVILVVGFMISLAAVYEQVPALGQRIALEGIETRFGLTNSVLWSTATSAASNGSVNAMHSSLSPMAGAVAMFNIMLGEIVFGGVGAGLYGMLIFVFLTVFLCGLMVGRTPEYLGKKIETREIAWALIAILAPSAAILLGSGLSCVSATGLSSVLNRGPHGLSEILYAFSSASQNNGSAFAGLNANTPFYNVLLGLCMIVGRFAVIVPVIMIAGSLANKKIIPATEGTFQTDGGLFLMLLIAVIMIVGALTFFPALSLGPIVEHLLMKSGSVF